MTSVRWLVAIEIASLPVWAAWPLSTYYRRETGFMRDFFRFTSYQFQASASVFIGKMFQPDGCDQVDVPP